MNISDKELFNFIFYSEKLSVEQYEFIKNNLDNFKDEIDLLKLTKTTMGKKVSEETLNKIHQKIKDFEEVSFVKLEKIDSKTELDSELLTLAADSPKEKNSLKIETYADKLSKFLVKIISNEAENKLHIFNQGNEEIKDFELTILPSGTTFQIESTNIPILVKPKQEITSLSFRF